jgi:hypothetical protein
VIRAAPDGVKKRDHIRRVGSQMSKLQKDQPSRNQGKRRDRCWPLSSFAAPSRGALKSRSSITSRAIVGGCSTGWPARRTSPRREGTHRLGSLDHFIHATDILLPQIQTRGGRTAAPAAPWNGPTCTNRSHHTAQALDDPETRTEVSEALRDLIAIVHDAGRRSAPPPRRFPQPSISLTS